MCWGGVGKKGEDILIALLCHMPQPHRPQPSEHRPGPGGLHWAPAKRGQSYRSTPNEFAWGGRVWLPAGGLWEDRTDNEVVPVGSIRAEKIPV